MPKNRGFGSIQKLPSGRYRARYIDPVLGKRTTLGTYDRESEARLALAEVEEHINSGDWNPASKTTSTTLTVGGWVNQWLDIITHTHKPSTVQAHRNALARTLFDAPGKAAELQYLPLERATKKDIVAWWDALTAERGRIHDNFSGYRRLKTAFNAAVERELIPVNPCQVKDASKRPTPKRKELPSEHDIIAVIGALGDRYQLVAVLTLLHGLRIGEVLALRRKDIEHTGDGWVVHVRGSAYRKPGVGMVRLDTPKTAAGARNVPVFAKFENTIAHHMETYVEPEPDAPVCTTSSGAVLMDTSFRSILGRAKTKAGVTCELTPHYGRVWLITALVEAGMTIPAIGELLGQRDLKTITEVYMRTSEERKQEVLNKVNKLL